jgi:hypothetical protein
MGAAYQYLLLPTKYVIEVNLLLLLSIPATFLYIIHVTCSCHDVAETFLT